MASRRLPAAAAIAAVGVTLALATVPLARADGDPASDVLYGANLFPSYDSGISAANLEALQATLADSKKAGYEIRVAVIAKPDDLGAVTSLWAKPRQYARFLGTELGYVYKKPLLIVMPNGIGYYHVNHDSTPGLRRSEDHPERQRRPARPDSDRLHRDTRPASRPPLHPTRHHRIELLRLQNTLLQRSRRRPPRPRRRNGDRHLPLALASLTTRQDPGEPSVASSVQDRSSYLAVRRPDALQTLTPHRSGQ